MPAAVYVLIGVGIMAVPCLLLFWLLRRQSQGGAPLAELEHRLAESFSQARADIAARVEGIKGELRSDLADRLQQELQAVRETVAQQLTEGRREQAQGLSQAVAGLEQKFDKLEATTAQKLESIRSRVDEQLQGLSAQVQQRLERNIREGFALFQQVQDNLKAAEKQLESVGTIGQSINQLNSLLQMPHLRGKFGEAELGKLLADFLPAGAYEEQAQIVPDSKEAVDAVVKFPQARLPIDSKFNREQILPLFETGDPQALKEARKQLAVVIKQQAQSIHEKYVHPEHGTTDLALMFLPSETIYFEVIRNIELCEALHKLKVFPVSPNTLAITLKSVAMSFGFFEFAKNVDKTLEQIKQAQRSFALFQGKFEDVGKGLEKAQQAYGTAAGHLNRYSNRVVRLTGETLEEPPAEAVLELPGAEAGAGATPDRRPPA